MIAGVLVHAVAWGVRLGQEWRVLAWGMGECTVVRTARVSIAAGAVGGHMVLGVSSSTARMLAKDVGAARCLSAATCPFDYSAACDMGT